MKQLSIKELAGLIWTQLEKNGIESVLVGGGCVTIYSEQKYISYDLDFIAYESIRKIRPVLEEIGFIYDKKKYFTHPDCPFFIEFVSPPIAIGNEPVEQFHFIKTKQGQVKLLTASDCVKDRLAAYFYWNDTQSLEQAALVAKKQDIDLKEIKKWSIQEGNEKKFKDFLKKLNSL